HIADHMLHFFFHVEVCFHIVLTDRIPGYSQRTKQYRRTYADTVFARAAVPQDRALLMMKKYIDELRVLFDTERIADKTPILFMYHLIRNRIEMNDHIRNTYRFRNPSRLIIQNRDLMNFRPWYPCVRFIRYFSF